MAIGKVVVINKAEYDRLQEIREHNRKATQLLCDVVDERDDFLEGLRDVLNSTLLSNDKVDEIKKLVNEYYQDID